MHRLSSHCSNTRCRVPFATTLLGIGPRHDPAQLAISGHTRGTRLDRAGSSQSPGPVAPPSGPWAHDVPLCPHGQGSPGSAPRLSLSTSLSPGFYRHPHRRSWLPCRASRRGSRARVPWKISGHRQRAQVGSGARPSADRRAAAMASSARNACSIPAALCRSSARSGHRRPVPPLAHALHTVPRSRAQLVDLPQLQRARRCRAAGPCAAGASAAPGDARSAPPVHAAALPRAGSLPGFAGHLSARQASCRPQRGPGQLVRLVEFSPRRSPTCARRSNRLRGVGPRAPCGDRCWPRDSAQSRRGDLHPDCGSPRCISSRLASSAAARPSRATASFPFSDRARSTYLYIARTSVRSPHRPVSAARLHPCRHVARSRITSVLRLSSASHFQCTPPFL